MRNCMSEKFDRVLLLDGMLLKSHKQIVATLRFAVRAHSEKPDIPHTQFWMRRNIASSEWITRIRVAAASQKASPGVSSSWECSTPLSSCVSRNDANLISSSPPLDISNILSSPSISYVLPMASNSYFLRSSSSSSAFRST